MNEEPSIAAREAPANPSRSALRSLTLGSVLCLGVAVGVPVSTHLLRGSYMDLDYSTPAAVFILFVLTAIVNPLLGRFWRRAVLQPAEILIIYAMLIVACALTTMGMASQLVPTLAASRYYAETQPEWLKNVVPHLKPWLIPDDHAANRLFMGLKPGEHLPWQSWTRPLGLWVILLAAFYLFSICLMAIMRRQWIERERLAYPLAQLPIDLSGASSQRLLRSPALWLGFGTAFVLASMRGMHHYVPIWPDVDPVWSIPVFRGGASLSLRVSFPMIGFFFLANADAVFSLWVFNRIFWLIQAWMNEIGTQYRADLGPYSAEAFVGYIALGGFLGVAITTIRAALPHLRDVARSAVGLETIDDSTEPLPYRFAFWGTITGLAIMTGWLYAAGMSPLLLVLFMVAVVAIFLTLTRVVIESGMAEAVPPTVPAGFTNAVLGSQSLGPHALSAESMTYIWAGDVRTTVMCSSAHAFRFSQSLDRQRRALPFALLLAIVITAPAALVTTLYLGYTLGGTTLNSWFFIDGPHLPYNWIATRIANPMGPNYGGWSLALIGALFTGLLAILRQRYVWWPFHPVGFAIAPTWIVNEVWLSAFIAWLVRLLVVRYGGLRAFQGARPYFLGLILGQFTCNGAWLILDALTGARGNQVFWI